MIFAVVAKERRMTMSKIKAIDPKIIVNRDVDRPYYSIEYYDTSDNQWHIGYSSYELKNVIEWLDTDFDVIKADVEPVRHGHWIINSDGYYPQCSECMSEPRGREMTKYCGECGAKMDGDKYARKIH